MALTFYGFGWPFIVIKEREKKTRLQGLNNVAAGEAVAPIPGRRLHLTLKQMDVDNQIAKQMMELSRSQDYEIGDGTKVPLGCYSHQSHKMMTEETKQRIHDALCVARILIRRNSIVYVDGSAQMSCSIAVKTAADSHPGVEQYAIIV